MGKVHKIEQLNEYITNQSLFVNTQGISHSAATAAAPTQVTGP